MILNGDFFTIIQLDPVVEGKVQALLSVNPDHKIFEGHFPGRPIVPGVCMMQMIQEILQLVTGAQTNLVKAQDMKFLAVINPVENNIIQASVNYELKDKREVAVVATLSSEKHIHFKFKGLFDFPAPHS